MKKYFLSTLMLFSVFILSAQNKQIQLTLLDNSTLQPIENVKVLKVEKNQNLGLSDKNGKVSINMNNGYIVLIHPEYLKQEVLITESATEGVVYLSGTLKTADEAQNASKLAQTVEGVKRVESSIRVKP